MQGRTSMKPRPSSDAQGKGPARPGNPPYAVLSHRRPSMLGATERAFAEPRIATPSNSKRTSRDEFALVAAPASLMYACAFPEEILTRQRELSRFVSNLFDIFDIFYI